MHVKQRRSVLLVDDDPEIVSLIQDELNTPPHGRYSYDVESFTEPLKALGRAKEKKFDIVITDYQMPVMDGIQFLKAMLQIQPDCARIVLSGETGTHELIRMINEAHVYRFIPKPWHSYFLKGSVAQAIDCNTALIEHKQLAALVHSLGIPTDDIIEEDELDRLLIVDDDPLVLSSLPLALTHHSKADDVFAAIRAKINQSGGPVLNENRIKVHTAASARQALKMAQETEYSCIIAAYKMQEMGGIELLECFSDQQPDCTRMLISESISQNDLIYAVDTAHIATFIYKPWSDFDLKAQIAMTLARRRVLKENRLLAEMVKKSRALA
ncbi:MAG: response regulator [Rhodocyclaceae bacterium]